MGYFKIDRQIFDHWLWDDKPFSRGQAWIDLIGLANYEDGKTLYRGKVVSCERGTVYRSISYLADRWGWSWEKTKNFLSSLESDNMVKTKTTTNLTTITLMNYGKFQDVPGTNSATNREPTCERTESATGKERRIIKNNKNNKHTAAAVRDEAWEGFVEEMKRRGEWTEEDERIANSRIR